MPSPRGTNKAGLFIPASPRFGAAYDGRRGLGRDAALSTSPNSGAPMGRRAEDDDPGEGEHPAHEVLRRARASLSASECQQLRDLLGRLLMAEQDDGEPDDEDADGTTGTPDAGADTRQLGRDETPPFSGRPRPGGEMDPIVKRAQDAAWQHFLAFDAVSRRRRKEQLAAATDMALIITPRDLSVRHAAQPPRIATDAAADREFAARCPEVARVKII
jgi:hypothetical protein